MKNDELTPEEKKAFDALPRERKPSQSLEKNTVTALRVKGILQERKRFKIQLTPFQLAGTVTVMIILMAGIFSVGYWSKPTVSIGELPTLTGSNQLPIAAQLQGAGTAYLTVLGKIAMSDKSESSKELMQSREIALKFLLSFADETTRVLPENDIASGILEAFQKFDSIYCQSIGDGEKERIIWF